MLVMAMSAASSSTLIHPFFEVEGQVAEKIHWHIFFHIVSARASLPSILSYKEEQVCYNQVQL